MKLSTLLSDHSAGFRAALAVLLCCGGLQAASLLTATPGTVALTCNTITGPGSAATIVVKPVAALTNNTIAVTPVALNAGLVVTPPASALVASPVMLTCVRKAGTPVSYTPGLAQTASVYSAAAGCSTR